MTEATFVVEEVKLPKGAKELKDCIVLLVKKLHDKAPLADIVASELSALKSAIEDLGELPADVKVPAIAVVAGLLGGQVGEALLTPSAAVAPAAAPAPAEAVPPPSTL